MGGPCSQPSERSHVDNFALTRSQEFQALAAHQKRRACVGREDRVPLLECKSIKFDCFIVPCVIHEDINAAKPLRNCSHRTADTGLTRDVTPYREPTAAQILD